MAIRFFFEYDGELVMLPVNPAEFSIKSESDNETTEVVKLGEINILKGLKLAECSIEAFFPVKNSGAPYILTYNKFKKPDFYTSFFNKIRKAKKPCTFTVSGLKIDMLVSIENFERSWEAGDDDTHYLLDLKAYEPYKAIKQKTPVKKKQQSTKGRTRSKGTSTKQSNRICKGDTVIVNGTYHNDSYGSGPHGTFKNFTGKVNIIVADKKRKYRYHITTLDGGFRGWVKASQIKEA
jgi:hypothetical protein